jgi:GAF domain-containing protein
VLVAELRSLLKGEYDFIANTANFQRWSTISLPDVNWAGFYFLKDEELVLVHSRKTACVRIPFGKAFVDLPRSSVKLSSCPMFMSFRTHRL